MHFVRAKGLLSAKNGMNVYRGCLHGCIYCDARSDCYNMPHAFEDIAVKENAPELLAAALRSKRRRCMIGTGAMCDPYLPIEKELEITRRCLEIIERERFGVSVLTKSDLIMRDIDLLENINNTAKAVVQITVTTADEALCRIVEPNVCTSARRFEVMAQMQSRGIPTVLWFTPLLPYINDTEDNVRRVVRAAAETGCRRMISFGMGLTLRSGDREHYYAALDRHFPGLKQRYIREYGNAYELPSPRSAALWRVFCSECERAHIDYDMKSNFEFINTLDEDEQLTLF
ncbi:MAG: SPL family radical SAM protein [Oscillospiraceae bacterium]